MKNFLANVCSYISFMIRLDCFLAFSMVFDFLILAYSVINYKDVLTSDNIMVLVFAIMINFCWQLYNLIHHFHFLQKVKPAEKELSNLYISTQNRIDYSKIKIKGLNDYRRDDKLGILESESINLLLRDKEKHIKTIMMKAKEEKTRKYILHYKENLLVFLNHKWHKINDMYGVFTNDEKLCLASEFDFQSMTWGICKGYYYNGYLTNTIYNNFIGGTNYLTFPPFNSLNTPIHKLHESCFSDHIGISTLVVTSDNHTIIFQQSYNAGQSRGKVMPSGSGSMDYADYMPDMDFRNIIIKAAEREFIEEANIKKLETKMNITVTLNTEVISFYRDMERGGKPEFCCVTYINQNSIMMNNIEPNRNELAEDVVYFPKLLNNDNEWRNEILPQASLSLKMAYRATMAYLQ